MNIESVRQENQILKAKIQEYRQQKQMGPGLRTEIQKFMVDSKKNIKQMNERSVIEQEKANQKLHQITQKYENVLKQQIALLTQNKSLSEKKDLQDQKFNGIVQKLTKDYEVQIADFEKKVKANVQKIKSMGGGGNIIKKLIKNDKFKAAMAERGCNLIGLQKQSQLEQVAEKVEERQKQIQIAQNRSAALDEELQKMHQLVQTMKELMQNMQKEKQNILKQNSILKEKLQQSSQLIGKLLGQNGVEQEQDEQEKVNDE